MPYGTETKKGRTIQGHVRWIETWEQKRTALFVVERGT